MEEKVEQILDATMGFKSRTGKKWYLRPVKIGVKYQRTRRTVWDDFTNMICGIRTLRLICTSTNLKLNCDAAGPRVNPKNRYTEWLII